MSGICMEIIKQRRKDLVGCSKLGGSDVSHLLLMLMCCILLILFWVVLSSSSKVLAESLRELMSMLLLQNRRG